MSQNGVDREADNTERLISLVARMNEALRAFSESLRSSSALQDRGFERLEKSVDALRDVCIEIRHHLGEARADIEHVREETNPRVRIAPATEGDDGKGDGFEITAKQLRLPSAWAGVVLKAALSAGGGALLLRAVQWLAAGH